MSQKTYDIIKGIAQAAANAYDGAKDENGEAIKIGLKREEGNPMLDSRTMDGFKVGVNGNVLTISYQSDILLKDVYSGGFEAGLEQTMSDIASYLKKQYRKITKNTLSLSPQGEVDALVQSTSRVRVFVTARKNYKIGGMEDVDNKLAPSDKNIEKDFKSFLELGGLGKKAKNDTRRG